MESLLKLKCYGGSFFGGCGMRNLEKTLKKMEKKASDIWKNWVTVIRNELNSRPIKSEEWKQN
ncbi:MAG TPA: hypothetical protein PKK94_26880 [Leptospiraceae bacterium]|nr:hypothetical protein [Leptospiraceae bacterium]